MTSRASNHRRLTTEIPDQNLRFPLLNPEPFLNPVSQPPNNV